MDKTMTAEEVEHDRSFVAEVLGGLGAECKPHITALTRLAAQAARVLELESANAALALTLGSACDSLVSAGHRDLSERWRAVLALSAPGTALLVRLRNVESERDAAQQEAGANANGWRVVGARRDALETEAATLRERVATLEQERVASDEHHRDTERALAAQRDTLEGCLEGAKDREKAILERVRELEAALERELVGWSAERSWCSRCRTATAQQVDADGKRVRNPHQHAEGCPLAPQPPPAPAQGVDLDALSSVYYGAHLAEAQRYREESGRRGWKDAAHRAGLAAVVACLSPTPAPGLREAVDLLMPALRVMAADGRPDSAATNLHSDYRFDATFGQVRSVVAAYDATGGEHGPVVPDDVRTELAGYLYEAQGLTGHVRELLAPGDRGRLRLTTLRKMASILDVKPGVSR